jgi:hypothetical protein
LQYFECNVDSLIIDVSFVTNLSNYAIERSLVRSLEVRGHTHWLLGVHENEFFRN